MATAYKSQVLMMPVWVGPGAVTPADDVETVLNVVVGEVDRMVVDVVIWVVASVEIAATELAVVELAEVELGVADDVVSEI